MEMNISVAIVHNWCEHMKSVRTVEKGTMKRQRFVICLCECVCVLVYVCVFVCVGFLCVCACVHLCVHAQWMNIRVFSYAHISYHMLSYYVLGITLSLN